MPKSADFCPLRTDARRPQVPYFSPGEQTGVKQSYILKYSVFARLSSILAVPPSPPFTRARIVSGPFSFGVSPGKRGDMLRVTWRPISPKWPISGREPSLFSVCPAGRRKWWFSKINDLHAPVRSQPRLTNREMAAFSACQICPQTSKPQNRADVPAIGEET